MKLRRGALILAIVLTVAVLVTECLLAPSMNAIRRAGAAEFWGTVAGVDISGAPNRRWFGVVTLRDERFVYNSPGMDDIWIEWIPEREAMAAWPAAEAELEKVSAANPESAVAIGYQRWKAASVRDRRGVVGLNLAISVAIDERVNRERPQTPLGGDSFMFERIAVESCAAKLNWYWATICFEFLFLGGLIWWLLWPVMRGSGLTRYLVHWGLAPTLFLLPNWLGYAVRVPNVYQSGGILYTLMMMLGGSSLNTTWDAMFLSHLPPIFEPLSQHAWVDPWDPQGMRWIDTQPGPTSALIAGVFIMGIVFAGWFMIKFNIKPWLEKHRPRGFDVVMKEAADTKANEC